MISLPINVKEKYYRSIILTTAEIGIEIVTVRKAAAKLNMSEAALYRHFQGKEELFNETYLFADSLFWHAFIHSFYSQGFADKSFDNVLVSVWKDMLNFLKDNPALTSFLARFRASYDFNVSVKKDGMLYSREFDPIYSIIETKIGPCKASNKAVAFDAAMDACISFAFRSISGEIAINDDLETKLCHIISDTFSLLYHSKEI